MTLLFFETRILEKCDDQDMVLINPDAESFLDGEKEMKAIGITTCEQYLKKFTVFRVKDLRARKGIKVVPRCYKRPFKVRGRFLCPQKEYYIWLILQKTKN